MRRSAGERELIILALPSASEQTMHHRFMHVIEQEPTWACLSWYTFDAEESINPVYRVSFDTSGSIAASK